jgi:hypothetical protein
LALVPVPVEADVELELSSPPHADAASAKSADARMSRRALL